jgi:16S rRNA (uracil1498-N3)-methyltransferase
MPKYFLAPEAFKQGIITVPQETKHHLLRVLRLRPGERVLFCDGQNTDYTCVMLPFVGDELRFDVIGKNVCLNEPPYAVTLYQGVPKGDKMDEIVQKAVELGASRIVPLLTARTELPGRDFARRVARWQRIAQSAAGQCMRGIIPLVAEPLSLIGLKKTEPLWFIAYEGERQTGIPNVLQSRVASDIGIFIGPEGGFAEDEIQTLPAVPVTLGRRVLRTETAGIAALAQVMCCWEENSLDR